MTGNTKNLNIAILTHNEETNIRRCLLSVLESTRSPEKLNIMVLINGTTDSTLEIVKQIAEKFPQIKYMDIAIGDKSNAWNEYVYSGICLTETHYFMDGDNWLPALSLDKLEMEFDTSKDWGIAPSLIGISESLREFSLQHGFLSGGLYGLSGEFLSDIVNNNFKFPVGFIGDDSLVTYLLQEGINSESNVKGIKMVEFTGAVVPRLKLNFSTISLIHTRYKRYAIRHFQQEVLYFLGRENRLDELPRDNPGFKKFFSQMGLRPFTTFQGVQTLYHPYAFFKLLLAK